MSGGSESGPDLRVAAPDSAEEVAAWPPQERRCCLLRRSVQWPRLLEAVQAILRSEQLCSYFPD